MDASSDSEPKLPVEAASDALVTGSPLAPEQSSKDETHKTKPKWNPSANHGRYGYDDYCGCETIIIEHARLSAGMPCPKCGKYNPGARLVREKTPRYIVQLFGHGIISGKRYALERLRCNLCSEYFTATVPNDIKPHQSKYTPSCCSTLAIHRYEFGFPFKRIETAQAMQGIPVPDASQWDAVHRLWTLAKPAYQALEYCAAQGQPTYDDTPNRIVESLAGIDKRKGVYTTALVSRYEHKNLYLFRTSHQYAGENISDWMAQRETDEALMSMSDASAMNIPTHTSEKLLAHWIFCFCLVHGRRKFFKLQGYYDKESDFVLELIGEVYQHEQHCQAQELSARERLSYHQQYSSPLMTALFAWLMNKMRYEKIETTRILGEAITYLLKHWHALTQFLRVPGALLDTNLAERAIKVVIRHRRNSLFYKTTQGAKVGDGLMSLIHTARCVEVNPYDYLNALQNNAVAVKTQPQQWLPWNYQQAINYHQAA